MPALFRGMNGEPEAAARLCAACGLCCNGVMFHTVQLQPDDAPSALVALGLRLKRKKGRQYLLQPCPMHCGSSCAIYAERPARCRRFECRQLQRVAAGESTEALALEKIREVQRRVVEMEALLQAAGATNAKRPLAKRCEQAMAVPLDASAEPAVVEARGRLTRAMAELDAMLDADFRVAPGE